MLGYFCAAAALSAVLPTQPLAPSAAMVLFSAITMPLLSFVAIILLGMFCFGFDADLNARESCFPTNLFTLPVGTGELVGWPLAFGMAAAGLMWVFCAWFILRPWMGPWGMTVPLWWPAMCAAAGLAWMQALLWWPYGLPGVRIVLATAVFAEFAYGVGRSVYSSASEGKLLAIYAGLAAVAWVGAYVGVRRARRGEVPNWLGLFRPFHRLAACLPRSRRPFASAAGAQVWFEWRCTGNSLPVMTGLVLPIALSPLALLGKNEVIPTANTLLGALAIPVFLGGIAGVTTSRDRSLSKEQHGLAPFTATLPMSTAGMVGARLKSAALSVLATWALVAVVVPLALVLTGTDDEVAGWWHQALRTLRPIEVIAALVAVGVLLPLWTWKRHVDSLLVELAGRKWVTHVALSATVGGTIALGFGGAWIYHHPANETLLMVFPWLLGVTVLAKLLMAGLAVRQARRGLLPGRAVACWAAGELLLAAVLFGLLVLSVPEEPLFWYYLACGILWCLPMARLAAAPLALAWNRHR